MKRMTAMFRTAAPLLLSGIILSALVCIVDLLSVHLPDPFAIRGTAFASDAPASGMRQSAASTRLYPEDFEYLGAFRLPDDGDRPRTFEYGGSAMTYSPAGDPGGSGDGFPGSLFIMGHNRMPSGELPDGNQVAEVSIPKSAVSSQVDSLNQATFVQGFRNVAAGHFTTLDEIPRVGMLYLDNPATGPRIHLTWGQHLQDGEETQIASHAWFSPTLSTPNFRGTWYIGNQSLYSVNGYIMEIPTAWANQHVSGHPLATGRYKDGGWSGMGPALFTYIPWTDGSGTPAPSGTHLSEKVLLRYAKSNETDLIERCLNNYQHADEWEGGAWITTTDGRSAVLFAGTKGTGAKYWYGFINPAGPQYPCVAQAMVGDFTTCRLADGTPCPSGDFTECAGHTSERGWWSSSWQAQFILYDPDDLVKVAAGQMDPWQPQPYATMSIDDRLFMNPSGVDIDALGTGAQRRYRIGEAAYDRANNLLYVPELFADGAKPVIHVWRIGGNGASPQTLLYFPHIATINPWQTEIAVINTGSQTVTGTLQGMSDGGQLVETRNVTLSARGRREINIASEFTNHANIGYIIFSANSNAVRGYTKFYNAGQYRTAIPAVSYINTSDIYVSHIALDAAWWTGVSLVNTTADTKNLTITFNDGQARNITLSGGEHRAINIGTEYFNSQPRTDIQSAVISNAAGVIGLELFGSSGWGSQLEGILLTDRTASTIYYPHVAAGDWWTGIVAYNPSTQGCTITITPYSAEGAAFTASTLPLEGKAKYLGAVAALGLPAQTAWFRIASTRPLSGFELFGTINGRQLGAYAGDGGAGAKEGIFAKVEKAGWTGIAFVNTEAGAATVTLTAYNDEGGVVATRTLNVEGYAKVVNTPEDIFSQDISAATYIAFNSDRNVVGFQLNGSADGTMLDGLPGM